VSVGLSGRVVAVTADRGAGAPGGRYAYGSGCLVNGTTVLTAAHVVAGAQSVSIRTSAWVKHEATVDPDFIGDPRAWHPDHPSAPDLTLLTLATSLEMPRMPVARVNRGHKAGLIERARSLGYPWFEEQELPGEGPVRVQAPVVGQLLLSEREDGRLDFQVTIAPPEALSGSQWAGMSGAPVTASGRLIGVITEHPGRSGASTITVTPLTALHADTVHPGWGSGVPDPEAWWARLGIADPDKLAVLPAAAEAEYRATLREIDRELQQRVPVLEGRDTELTAIGDFATGKEGYRWLMGDAFTGKTALIHRATTAALPDNVDVVAYFLRRTASDANSVKFLAAVTSQLRALLGPETSVAPGLDEHAFRWL